LTKKIANEKVIRVGEFIPTACKDMGYQTYECKRCNQIWALYTPDGKDRGGFFAITKQTFETKKDFRISKRFPVKTWLLIMLALLIAVRLFIAC
jgi:hypothetical protein